MSPRRGGSPPPSTAFLPDTCGTHEQAAGQAAIFGREIRHQVPTAVEASRPAPRQTTPCVDRGDLGRWASLSRAELGLTVPSLPRSEEHSLRKRLSESLSSWGGPSQKPRSSPSLFPLRVALLGTAPKTPSGLGPGELLPFSEDRRVPGNPSSPCSPLLQPLTQQSLLEQAGAMPRGVREGGKMWQPTDHSYHRNKSKETNHIINPTEAGWVMVQFGSEQLQCLPE